MYFHHFRGKLFYDPENCKIKTRKIRKKEIHYYGPFYEGVKNLGYMYEVYYTHPEQKPRRLFLDRSKAKAKLRAKQLRKLYNVA